jgi:hypothetical protein
MVNRHLKAYSHYPGAQALPHGFELRYKSEFLHRLGDQDPRRYGKNLSSSEWGNARMSLSNYK